MKLKEIRQLSEDDLKLRIEDLTKAADFGKKMLSEIEDTAKSAYKDLGKLY